MQLVVLHYHLLPGGVTGVIVEGTRFLLRNMKEIERITLVCGRSENTEAVRALVLDSPGPESLADRFFIEVEPLVDYSDRTGPEDAGRIGRLLLSRYCGPDTILWVHNFQLAKNPALTRAVVDIALNHPDQRIILQIHDFPECARYDNLARLNREVTGTVYPSGPNVRYALINSRDRAVLVEAGIPEESVALLENPVEMVPEAHGKSALWRRNSAEVRRLLFDSFGDSCPAADRDAPILLYPVRTIRRKNVLEAGFIVTASRTPVNLFVTLPGVSAQERIYSDMVRDMFRGGMIPGLWGFGREMEALGLSFGDVVTASDVVLSSSVQEGFGYQFVNALVWGKPLVARYLNILESILPVFDGHPHMFYRSVTVPPGSPSIRALRPYLSHRYNERLDSLKTLLPPAAIESLHAEIEALLASDGIDFSYLPVQMQFTLLKDLRDPGYLADIRSLNSDLVDSVDRLVRTPARPLTERVERRFGAEAFTRSFESLVRSFPENGGGRGVRSQAGTRDREAGATYPSRSAPTAGHREPDAPIRTRLVAAFARLEHVRLIFEAMPEAGGVAGPQH
ncbi:hypothetical protein [Salinispira pacifica]